MQVHQFNLISICLLLFAWFNIGSCNSLPTLSTKNFTTAVSEKIPLALIVFYDPTSVSFQELEPELAQIPALITNKWNNSYKVLFYFVDATIDTYLQELYAPEMTSSWQAPDETHGFRFGLPNYYGTILKLFKYGKMVKEYDDVIEAEFIVNFLMRESTPLLEPTTESEIQHIKLHQTPTLYGCIVDDTCDQLAHLLKHVYSKYFAKYSYTVLLNTEANCKLVHPELSNCKLAFTNAETTNLLPPLAPAPLRNQTKELVKLVKYSEAIVQLTPDNSWKFMDEYDLLVVLLQHSNSKDSIEETVLRKTFYELSNEEKDKIRITWAEESFAMDFGKTINDLPIVVAFNVVTDKFKTFDGEFQVPQVLSWIRDSLNLAKESSDYVDGIDTVELEINTIEEFKLEKETNQSSVKVSNATKPIQQIDLNDLKERLNIEVVVPWFETVPILENIEKLSMETIWEYFLTALEEFYTMKEAFEASPVETQHKEQIRVGKFLEIQKIVDGLPVTFTDTLIEHPDILSSILKDSNALAVLKQKLEKLDDFRFKLIKENDSKQRQYWSSIVHQIMMLLHETQVEVHFVYHAEREANETEDHAECAAANRDKTEENPCNDKSDEVFDTKPIDIRHASDFSMEEFYKDYALKRKPVIIRGMTLTKSTWNIEHLRKVCGKKHPHLVVKRGKSWGGLQEVNETITMDEYFDTFQTNITRKKWYVHDWSLPRFCPEILGQPPFEEFTFPKYFAGDYFQRMPFVGYQHSWPSLFVGANQTESKIHVDSGGTNFWMYLVSGKKEWRFFDRQDKYKLYPEIGTSHYNLDVFRPDFNAYPMAKHAIMYQGFQEPGDIIYIPGGCPHGVFNHDDIIGMSMNYLDSSNHALYLWLSLLDLDLADFELYVDPKFPLGIDMHQKDLTFGEFKSTNWRSKVDHLVEG